MRDNQRQRLYDAERITVHRLTGGPFEQTIPNDELQAWVDAVLSRRAVRSRWGTVTVDVVLKRGGRGYSWGGRITLPKFARNEWVVLHELAHELNHHGAPHGPEFAGIYLWLVRVVLGNEAAQTLRSNFKAKRVRYSMKGVPKPSVAVSAGVHAVAAVKR